MRRAPPELNPRSRPRSHLPREGRSSRGELAPTAGCGAPSGPSVPHGACGLLSGETGRGCCLLRGNPWAAFLGDWEVWRSSDRALERGAHGAKASLPAWAGTARGTAPAGASAGTEGASACARACAPPPGLGSALLRGPCRAASCACLSPLALLAGEATLAGPLRRWPATFWLNKSMSQTNLTSQAPAAAVGRGPSGSIPAPPVLTGPAPASPGAPTRASLRLCASLAPPLPPPTPRLLLSFPTSPLLPGVGLSVAEDAEPFGRKFGPWTTPVPGHG